MKHNRNGTGRKVIRMAGAIAGLTFAIVGWLQLAPPSLGGHTSYAVITGNSMEPMLHGGDLVVIRSSTSYEEGDVAGYRSNQIHNLVLHRIIGTESDRFVTKGDNNDFVDAEKPSAGQFVGRLWFKIPRVGMILAKVRDPRIAVPFAAVIGLVLLSAFRSGRGRERRTPVPSTPKVQDVAGASSWGAGRKVAAGCAIGLFVASSAAGAIAFTRPTQTSLTKTVDYEQQGSFSYLATVDRGSVYDSGTVGTGEPVYLRVAKDLTVDFDYGFVADSPADITGSGVMTTTLAASNGWSRTVAETSPTEVSEGTLHLEQQLDVAQLQGLVEDIQKQTGVSETSYTLAFAADIESAGKIEGHDVKESFSSSMPFQLDSFQLKPDSGSDGGAVQDPTNSSEAGRITLAQTSQGHINAGVLSIDVPALRVASIGGLVLALLIFVLTLFVGRRSTDELQAIEARNGDLIVRVRSADRVAWNTAIEVEDFEALKKLSDAYETMVLHDTSKNELFFTICEAQVYFCKVSSDELVLLDLPLLNSVTFIEDLQAS